MDFLRVVGTDELNEFSLPSIASAKDIKGGFSYETAVPSSVRGSIIAGLGADG